MRNAVSWSTSSCSPARCARFEVAVGDASLDVAGDRGSRSGRTPRWRRRAARDAGKWSSWAEFSAGTGRREGRSSRARARIGIFGCSFCRFCRNRRFSSRRRRRRREAAGLDWHRDARRLDGDARTYASRRRPAARAAGVATIFDHVHRRITASVPDLPTVVAVAIMSSRWWPSRLPCPRRVGAAVVAAI